MPVPVAAIEQARARIMDHGPPPPAVLQGLRVLVVEDVAVLAWQVRDILEAAGAEVVGPAPDVRTALALLAKREVDAAVLDKNLADETADPVADVLAARNVPFVFVTGYDSNDIPGRHGERPILGKPFKALALVRAVADCKQGPGPRTGPGSP